MHVAPFEIAAGEAGAARVASNGVATLTLQSASDTARLFRRRAVKGAGSDQAQAIEWIVAELDGVRVYFDGVHVVVTREDLNP
jgi:hypothetical protein